MQARRGLAIGVAGTQCANDLAAHNDITLADRSDHRFVCREQPIRVSDRYDRLVGDLAGKPHGATCRGQDRHAS